MTSAVLAQALGVERREVDALCEELAPWLRGARRPASCCATSPAGGGCTTHPDAAPVVEQFVLASRHARLTKAALETLAIVAYKQPVTRHQISRDPRRELRRASCGRSSDRGLVAEVGPRGDAGPSGPVRDDAGVPRAARAVRRSRRCPRSRRFCVRAPPSADARGRRAAEATRLTAGWPDRAPPACARPRRVRVAPRVRGADRRRPRRDQRAGRDARRHGRSRRRTRCGSTVDGQRRPRASGTFALHKPRGRHDDHA